MQARDVLFTQNVKSIEINAGQSQNITITLDNATEAVKKSVKWKLKVNANGFDPDANCKVNQGANTLVLEPVTYIGRCAFVDPKSSAQCPNGADDVDHCDGRFYCSTHMHSRSRRSVIKFMDLTQRAREEKERLGA